MAEMKKPIFPGIMLSGIVLLGLSDVTANTDSPNNEVTSPGNSSVSATITIMMTGVLNE